MHKYIFYKNFHRLLCSHLIINRELNFNLNLGLVVPLHAAGLLVLGEVGLEREGLAAVGTAEGLVRAVRLHMGSQIALVRKCFRTNVTPKRLLARVGADVALQQPGPGEAFATKGTVTARTAVALQMHSKRCSVVKHLRAKVTLGGLHMSRRLFGRGSSMDDSLVALQVAPVGVRLATNATRILLPSSRMLRRLRSRTVG